jgi:hypothetical protein
MMSGAWSATMHKANGHIKKAARLSTAAAHEELRWLIWDDLIASVKEQSHGDSVITQLKRLCVA